MSQKKKSPTIQESAKRLKEFKKINDQEFVDYNKVEKKIGFGKIGINKYFLALREPIDANTIRKKEKNKHGKGEFVFTQNMKKRTKKRFDGIEDAGMTDGTADAYRHALSSYVASICFGEKFSKDLGDIHERDNPNPRGTRLMDLYNNAIGRELAKDVHNRLRKPEDVIDGALKSGLLRTKPFQAKVEESSKKY